MSRLWLGRWGFRRERRPCVLLNVLACLQGAPESATEFSYVRMWHGWAVLCASWKCRAMNAYLPRTESQGIGSGWRTRAAALAAVLLLGFSCMLRAQTDCLACHADKTLQDASGHSAGVDADNFHASIHGSLGCADCHSSIKEY